MKLRAALGAVIWLVIAITTISLLSDAELDERWARLWHFATRRPQKIELKVSKNNSVTTGERVLGYLDGRYELVGRVEAVRSHSPEENIAVLVMDPETAAVTSACQFQVVDAQGNMGWALRTMLPEHKMQRIKDELLAFKESHREELMDMAQIVARDLVNEAIDVLNANLSESVKKHEKEWRKVLEKHRQGLKTDLLPVLKERLGPRVKKQCKPILTKIGKELWNALPVWSVTWRAVADKFTWGQPQYMDKWWNEFLENKAIPIVKQHEDEFIELGEDLMIQAAEDKAVRNRLAVISRRLVNDKDFRVLVNKILHESLVEPFEGQKFMRALLDNPEVRQRFEVLASKFAPVMRRIAETVIEDDKTGGLNPDLVQVVRRVFFEKQARALILHRPKNDSSSVISGFQFKAQTLTPASSPKNDRPETNSSAAEKLEKSADKAPEKSLKSESKTSKSKTSDKSSKSPDQAKAPPGQKTGNF